MEHLLCGLKNQHLNQLVSNYENVVHNVMAPKCARERKVGVVLVTVVMLGPVLHNRNRTDC